jgi:putative colanic acid biosynthesis acetyltransferase WcaF
VKPVSSLKSPRDRRQDKKHSAEQWFMRLDRFDNSSFQRGRGRIVEALWHLVSLLFVRSGLPGSKLRVWCLRGFGARLGPGVVIKPYLMVKFPWRLSIGAHSWIGEQVWIDNLDQVTIGAQCCISQGAYLGCGSHDWSTPSFDLITRPIVIEDEVWICARSSVGPGVHVGRGAVLGFASAATRDLAAWTCYSGLRQGAVKRKRLTTLPDHEAIVDKADP